MLLLLLLLLMMMMAGCHGQLQQCSGLSSVAKQHFACHAQLPLIVCYSRFLVAESGHCPAS
jgi:hypothetical protein